MENKTVKPIENITEEQEISLSDWIEKYQTSAFSKIELEDDINLIGYVFVKKEEIPSFLKEKQTVENYQTFTTKKPSDTSITELGISLTGDTAVNTVYHEKGLLGMLLEQFGSLLLFFVIFFLGARLLMGRGGG
ncbi:hypothetical protein IJM86_07810 [bacterium]|nr:hypothetical protein [bacterium]